ncbi:MAG: hypothetical protein ACI8P0_005505 [Planctomycetaceae bacterium]
MDSGQDLGEYDDVVIGDLNGDGSTDAFLSNPTAHIPIVKSVLFNDGTGGLIAGDHVQSDFLAGVEAHALGDLDGDGDLDVFVAGGGTDNRVLINDGFGGFQDSGQPAGLSGRDVALGDLDGDGDLDA